MTSAYEKELCELFDELVPVKGKAESVTGEMVRAVNQIIYRYYNDGDRVNLDYGKETCNPAARYLRAHGSKYVVAAVDSLFDEAWVMSDDYKSMLDDLAWAVLKQIDEQPELREQATDDMWDYKKQEDVWEDDEDY